MELKLEQDRNETRKDKTGIREWRLMRDQGEREL